MALLNILQFPDKRLKLKAEPVKSVDADIQKIIKDMFETMYEAQGVGLAATQVNIQKRIVVMDVSRDESSPVALVNPVITASEGSITWEEGCLSFPGVYAKVKRHDKITVEYLNEEGEKQTLTGSDLLGVCIQHEIDHLDGITFYDHLSPLKKKMMEKKLAKIRERSL